MGYPKLLCGHSSISSDVAFYLGVPDWSRRAAFLDTPIDNATTRRDALTRHYLDEYARFGGAPITPQEFTHETSALLWAHKISSLDLLRERGAMTRIDEIRQCLESLIAAG